jgi:hypothetical protein
MHKTAVPTSPRTPFMYMTKTNPLILFWLEKKLVLVLGVIQNKQIYRVEKCSLLNVKGFVNTRVLATRG